MLCEKGDLAGATSSASSKMIHGGLRYLEQAHSAWCASRWPSARCCCASAPHLVRPMRFVLPHAAGVAAALDGACRAVSLRPSRRRRHPARDRGDSICADDPRGAPLHGRAGAGFVYSDCVVDDARLTVARRARRRPARRRDRHPHRAGRGRARRGILAARRSATARREIDARILVNAAGPWALDGAAPRRAPARRGAAPGQGQPHRRAAAL